MIFPRLGKWRRLLKEARPMPRGTLKFRTVEPIGHTLIFGFGQEVNRISGPISEAERKGKGENETLRRSREV